jgi:sterol carrier protein 2
MDPPIQWTWKILKETRPHDMEGTPNGTIFGNGAQEYCERYGATWDHVAAIASKAHDHCLNNPYSQFQNKMTVEQVKADKKQTKYLTRAMCCPTSDGAGCVIIVSEEFVHKHGLEGQA